MAVVLKVIVKQSKITIFKNKIMNTKKDQKSKDADIKKQNQDFPNIPATSEKMHSEEPLKNVQTCNIVKEDW